MTKLLLLPPNKLQQNHPYVYQRCPPPARWHEHRLIILRVVLSLGPNTLIR
jgi:hypothetical protein